MRELKKDTFLTTEAVAKYLGVARRTVTEWAIQFAESGGTEGLPGFKIGKRQWRFDPEKIEEWVRRHNQPAVMANKTVSSKAG